MKFLADIEVEEGLKDSGGGLGSNGQILSSTGSLTSWINTTDTGNWTLSGNNIYNSNSGDVGIGTSSAPDAKLEVNGGIKIATDTDTASADKRGTLRFRTVTGGNSDGAYDVLEICMLVGTKASAGTQYEWVEEVSAYRAFI